MKQRELFLFTVFILAVIGAWFLLFGRAGATSFHTAWVDKGETEWSGQCVTDQKAECGVVLEGTEWGNQKQECKLLGGSGSLACIVGQKRTLEVSRSCEVETEACPDPVDYCDTLEGVQSEDEDCPTPPVDTCESEEGVQENGCTPVEEPKEEPKKESQKDFDYSQGPDGLKGDNTCQIEWHTIKGSKKVEIRWAEDMVFGNGYKSLITDDDGAETIHLESGKAKVEIRGRDSKTSWSESHIVSC